MVYLPAELLIEVLSEPRVEYG